MEDTSDSSSTHKSIASKGTKTTTIKESAEESGWTAYFDDLSNNIHQPKSYSSTISYGSSLISDAATKAAASGKISHDSRHVLGGSSKVLNKLRFKKTRSKEVCEDDSLEDTASSPVNSPKVKEFTASENYLEINEIEEEKKMEFDDHNGMKNNNDCGELKKRGVCLVPLSMLVNYFA